jgi:hypothetical protein
MGGGPAADGRAASRRLRLTTHATFSGALAWPYAYPWPPRSAGLIDAAYEELACRWHPNLDASTKLASM